MSYRSAITMASAPSTSMATSPISGGGSPSRACRSSPRGPSCADVDRERADRVRPHDLQPDPQPDEALTKHRIVEAPVAARHRDDLVELAFERHLLAERRARRARKRACPSRPSSPRRVRRRCSAPALRGVGEEHLVELGGAGDLADRPDVDAGRVHPDQQVGEPLVALAPCLGAADDEAPVRPLGQRGPDLLAVDDPLGVVTLALEAGRGLDVGEIAAGVGFGIALAPVLGAGDDAGQELALLLAVRRNG